MNNSNILGHTQHRPYPLPHGKWAMKQIWHELLFSHWPVKANELLRYIPKGVQLDLWDGNPWLTISPFYITGLRLRALPPIPFTSRFAEINVRTYVTYNGKPGVCFLSLDAANRLAVEAARIAARLPYMKARMKIDREGQYIRYYSKRNDPRGNAAVFRATYKSTESDSFHAAPGSLLHWLTERYCLYTTKRTGELLIGEIHHLPWSLQQAELNIETNTMAASHGIELPDIPPILTYTKRLEVLFWPIRMADG